VKAHHRGTHRAVAPRVTVERTRPLLRAMGITRVADVTGLDSIGIPVVMVCRPNARSVAVAQGKGLDLDAARASGIMESIEHWHAENIVQPVRYCAAKDLALRERLIDLDGLPKLSVGSFDAHRKIQWIEGWNLLDDTARWVPFEIVHTDYGVPRPPGAGCFLTTSTGLASGNTWVEAVLHGLYEVIERDAVAIWRAGGSPVRSHTQVDLASVDDPDCRELLARFERAGVAVGVWDATSDIGLPVFVAEIADRDAEACRLLYACTGQGCHRSRAIALARALTEAAQSRLTAISAARDDVDRTSYEQFRARDPIARALEAIRGSGERRAFQSAPDGSSETLEADLAAVLDALRSRGFAEAATVDLTRRELGVPVARVVIPGLESMWEAPGYVPGPRARAAGCS